MPGSVLDLLAQRGLTPLQRGRVFERLCRWYLQNDPVYRATLKKVWLWDDWVGRWGADAGVDLVAEGHDGRLWAIQAKAYHPDHTITKRDVDTFLSESARPEFAYRLLIATTDRIGGTALRTLQAQEKHAGLRLLSDLERSEVEWPSSLDDLRPPHPAPKRPRPHQEEALEAVLAGFADHERGQLIMACGTGKTLVGLWVTERLGAERTLVLLPSLSLLDQTLREWIVNTSRPFDFLAVCSDETVVGEDHLVSRTADLGLPVTTDPADIGQFLERSGPRVIFSTYQSSPRIAETLTQTGLCFDLAIADEAHRVAGPVSSDFGTVLDVERIRSRRRLFMTATPRYFTGRVRREAGDADLEVASMDDPDHFGPVLHRLTFAQAIERDLLSDYRVVIVGVDDPTYRRYAERGQLVMRSDGKKGDARTLAAQIGLAKAARDHDLRRIISFHGRVKRSQEFAVSFPEVVAWMPEAERPSGEFRADYVSGEMPSGAREVKLRLLRNLEPGERRLLANARCLAEGVDVPALDGVAFIDPRRSPIDIAQAVGRAIRKSADKTVGTVILPVFIEQAADAEDALESSVFKPVWEVLRALRAHDETLAEELDVLRQELGRRRVGALTLPERIVLDIPSTVGEDFARAFEARLVEQSTASWEFWFGLLLGFVERQGHARVPIDYVESGLRLGSWVHHQRFQSRRGLLEADRAARLEGLPGWVWDPHDQSWDMWFGLLKTFTDRECTSRVPFGHHEEGRLLGHWLQTQRRERRRGALSPDRVRRLEGLAGWTWEPYGDSWDAWFDLLQSFVEREGHATPLKGTMEANQGLGDWVAAQRRLFSAGRLSRERTTQLEAVPGWSWHMRKDVWESGFQALTVYVAREGHARVPHHHREGKHGLGYWVAAQRLRNGRGSVTAEQKARLEALPGWSWDPGAEDWEAGFQALTAYVAREGHARVPHGWSEDGFGLGQWVLRQRQVHRRGRLASEKVSRLEALPGWSWDPGAEDWEAGFQALTAYVAREGHARVPRHHREGKHGLGYWVATQRLRNGKGSVTAEQKARLEALPGWSWDPGAEDWEAGFQALTAYVAREGHARVPAKHREGDLALGAWVDRQRQVRKIGRLSVERAARLEDITGWVWDVLSADWEEAFQKLVVFSEREGHACVAASYCEDGFRLGQWVGVQRRQRAQNQMDTERAARLEALPGWAWDTRADRWETGFAHLADFVKREGHAHVPTSHREGDFRLGNWVDTQRSRWKKGRLSSDRARRLEELPGWLWDASAYQVAPRSTMAAPTAASTPQVSG